jgi:outer membrane receptor protein involved in Fe transport
MYLSTRKTLLSVAVCTALCSDGALAQLEEVLVTAERREARLQDTPLTIQALSSEELRDRGIRSAMDLVDQVAGVQGYSPPGTTSYVGINIRGVADGSPNLATDPSTARYIDGIYLGKVVGSGMDSNDLERIEILKGPQGTLYGRNSIAGAINFISKAPADEFKLSVTGSAGNYKMGSVSGRVDLPITDNFRTAFSMYSRKRDPFWENTNPTQEGMNNMDRSGFRGAFQWDATDRLSIDYSYTRDKVNDELDNHSVVSGLNPTYAGVAGYAAAGGDLTNVPIDSSARMQTVAGIAGFVQQFMPPFVLEIPQVQQYLGWSDDYIAWGNNIIANMENNPETGSTDIDSFNNLRAEAHTFKAQFELTDSIDIKYLYGRREVSAFTSQDLDGMDNSVGSGIQHDLILQTIGGSLLTAVVPAQIELAPGFVLPIPDYQIENFSLALLMVDTINERGGAPVFSTYAQDDYKQESHELQLVGTTGNIDWAAGLFYWDDEGSFRNVQNPTFPLANGTQSRGFDNGGDAFSVFGEATWRPANTNWAFTAGLRYTEETKDMTWLWRDAALGGVGGYVAAAIAEAAAQALEGITINIPRDLTSGYVWSLDELDSVPETEGVYGQSAEQDFDNVSGRLAAQYNFNDNMNVYASYTTGYRSGGYNGGSFNKATGLGDAFDEETISNVEIGFKSLLADGKIRLNAAAYYYQYEDVQVSTVKSDADGLSTEIDNAAELSREGFELEAAWLITDRIQISGNYAYIGGSYDSFPPYLGLTITPTDGLAPENSFYAALDWDLIRRGKHNVNFQLSGNYQDETISIGASQSLYTAQGAPQIPVNFQQPSNQSRTLVNTRLTYSYSGDNGTNFSVSAWGKNITDEDYRTFGYNLGADLGLPVHQWGDPATYGIDFRLDL